jgi:hypothetical protein
MRLEEFCSSGEFTDKINDFLSENCVKMIETQESHSIENYIIYKKYTELIESVLNKFISGEGIEAEDLIDTLRRVHEMEMEVELYSLDYILATTEYQDFYDLIMQHKVICFDLEYS